MAGAAARMARAVLPGVLEKGREGVFVGILVPSILTLGGMMLGGKR